MAFSYSGKDVFWHNVRFCPVCGFVLVYNIGLEDCFGLVEGLGIVDGLGLVTELSDR